MCICLLDLLMTEVVDCFVVGHWAVSHNKLTDRHVSRPATNVIEVARESLFQPKELYESLITTFSKEGDLILDIGSGNGKLSFHCLSSTACICFVLTLTFVQIFKSALACFKF